MQSAVRRTPMPPPLSVAYGRLLSNPSSIVEGLPFKAIEPSAPRTVDTSRQYLRSCCDDWLTLGCVLSAGVAPTAAAAAHCAAFTQDDAAASSQEATSATFVTSPEEAAPTAASPQAASCAEALFSAAPKEMCACSQAWSMVRPQVSYHQTSHGMMLQCSNIPRLISMPYVPSHPGESRRTVIDICLATRAMLLSVAYTTGLTPSLCASNSARVTAFAGLSEGDRYCDTSSYDCCPGTECQPAYTEGPDYDNHICTAVQCASFAAVLGRLEQCHACLLSPACCTCKSS